ncbi:MAG: hypothetical protein O7A04_00760, partial [Acidobacteria bacterium]|nr:hypothetical protein [Acidobacteriota bacterium]
ALIDLRDQTHERAEGAKASTAKRLTSYADELEALRGSLVSTSDAGWLSGDEKLREHLADVFGGIAGFDGRPTQSQIDRTAVLAEELDAAKGRFAELTGASSIEALNRRLTEPLALISREQWDEDHEKKGAGTTSLKPHRLQELMDGGWVIGLRR